MIRVDRSQFPEPRTLSAPYTRGEHRGLTERDVVLKMYVAHLAHQGSPSEFQFDYKAYKSDDVRHALHLLFHGKCAYCESRYASTQPMDVEHWRPKAQVHQFDDRGNTTRLGGYPWLASDWENLLPSCIDCNRPRKQLDVQTKQIKVQGKGNQFPIEGPRMRAPKPGGPLPPKDDALLLDPTVDDPSQHLEFHDDGTVTGISGSPKADVSIQVYALNRSELAFERLGIARLLEQRLTTIEALAAVLGRTGLDDNVRLDLEDLVAHEINALYEFIRPDRPYSEMARQIIEQSFPLDASPPSAAAPPWPAQVKSVLRRFSQRDSGVDHGAVATSLARLGFGPHSPQSRLGTAPSKATYLRWSYKGRLRMVRLYQDTLGLVSDSRAQLAFAESVEGAQGAGGAHPRAVFRYAHSSVETVLAAASHMRQWADE